MSDSITEHHQELIAGYALKTLTPEELAAAEVLLAEHPALQAELASYQSVMGLIAETIPPVKPPAALRSRILAAVNTAHPQTINPALAPSSVTNAPQLRRSRRWYGLTTGIAALLTIALGIHNYQLRQQLSQVQAKVDQLSQHEHGYYSFRLKSRDRDNPAIGLVAVNLEKKTIDLALDHLPMLEEGEAYHLWAFTKDQQKVLCGRFNASQAESVHQTLPVPPEGYPSEIMYMRLSREPNVTPPDPSRRVLVMTSEM